MTAITSGTNLVVRSLALAVGLAFGFGPVGGCGVFGKSSPPTNYVAQVGQYGSAVAPAAKPRLGVVAFALTEAAQADPAVAAAAVPSATTRPTTVPGAPLSAVPATNPAAPPATTLGEGAADAMAGLLAQSGRFVVTDRPALERALRQASLSDAVRPGAVVRPAAVPGVDLLLVGRVTDLRVTKQAVARREGISLDSLKAAVGTLTGRGGDEPTDVDVMAECGVGLQFVDPATRDVVLTNDSDFRRSGPPTSLGLPPGPPADSLAALRVTEDEKARVVRLALDDALRKSLPKIDRYLQTRPGATPPPAPPPAASPVASGGGAPEARPAAGASAAVPATRPAAAVATPVAPASASTRPAGPPQAGQKACPTCGHANPAAARFCDHCGAKLE